LGRSKRKKIYNVTSSYIFTEIQKDIYTEVMPNVWRKNGTIGLNFGVRITFT
jgi:hypothetical protein